MTAFENCYKNLRILLYMILLQVWFVEMDRNHTLLLSCQKQQVLGLVHFSFVCVWGGVL